MKILHELTKQPAFLNKDKDLTSLPEDMMKEIKKIIKQGANDLDQKWANALELVHHAYEQTGTVRPSPDMKDAWKQYEENIATAVEQLAKARGLNGDWRMSSSIFNESAEQTTYRIRFVDGKRVSETVAYTAKNIIDLAQTVKKAVNKNVEVKIKQQTGDKFRITFWDNNTKLRGYVEVTPVD